FNGDMGILYSDHASFPRRKSPIPKAILPKYDYGYCLSIHKSQGSESENILAIVPPGPVSRELLYTAVTRAKKSLELWTSPSTLEKALQQPYCRRTNMATRLIEAIP